MSRDLSLAPCGLVIDRIEVGVSALVIMAHPVAKTADCPICHSPSAPILRRRGSTAHTGDRWLTCPHMDGRSGSSSRRAGSAVFWRPAAGGYSPSGSRRRGRIRSRGVRHAWRVSCIISGWLSVAGPGKVARRLLLPVSKDTLLRVVRHHSPPSAMTPRVVGIDDWAFKRGHRYGTIICDLEQRRIIDLLPDREAATVTAWLATRPSIDIIARDRGAGYIQAATDGRPNAIQVADRWHLMENASAAFLTAVQRSMQAVRNSMGNAVVDPTALSCAERRQHSNWLRREEENTAILALAKQGVAIKQIMRLTGKSRGLVRQVVRGGRTDIFRCRLSSLGPFLKQLDVDWTTGCRNSAALWRRAKLAGFAGGLRVISEWVTRRRKEQATPQGARPRKVPSARAIARMMTSERGVLSKAAAHTMAIIDSAVPALVIARDLVDRFHGMIKRRASADLEPWITDASPGLLGSFAKGIVQDRAAVQAALTQPWSNGQTEGQNTKLKLVKRQMYGRANLDLLRARLLGAT